MTLDQFIAKWLGNRTDQDGVWGYQCVDLIKAYAKEVYPRVNPGAWGDALDYWRNTDHPLLQWYTRVANQSPQRGDIVIFKTAGRNDLQGAGHIAVAVTADTMLEQNGATGDGDGRGGDEIRYRTIPKTRIAGILRPKEVNVEKTIYKPSRADIKKAWNELYGAEPNESSYQYYVQRDISWMWHDFAYELKKKLDAAQVALRNEQNKPPVEVIKEVVTIVEKPIEVIKEVEVGEEEAVKGFLGRIADYLFNRFKKQ